MIKALIVLGFIIAAVLLYCVIGVVWDFGNREILAKMGRSVTLFSLTLTMSELVVKGGTSSGIALEKIGDVLNQPTP